MDDWFGLQGGLVAMGLLAAVPGCKDPDTDTTTGDTTSSEPGSTGDTGGTSMSGGTGDTPTGSDSGSGTGTTGDAEVPPVCVSYGAKLVECNIDTEPGEPLDAEHTCAKILMDSEVYGADCVQALEALYSCPTALSCAELTGACEAEMAAVEAACVPEVPPVCVPYGAKAAECLMEPDAAMAYEQMCAYELMAYSTYYGPACADAAESSMACLSGLSCEQFLGHLMDDLPVCEAEADAKAAACS